MKPELKQRLSAEFQHEFDKCKPAQLQKLRDVYNQEANNPALTATDRAIAEIKVEAADRFLRFYKDPKKFKHPMQG